MDEDELLTATDAFALGDVAPAARRRRRELDAATTAGDTAKGAAAGFSAGGPWGALIGGAAGLGSSILKQKGEPGGKAHTLGQTMAGEGKFGGAVQTIGSAAAKKIPAK